MKTKKSSPVLAVVGLILLVAGVVCSILARGGAIGEGAGDTGKLLYALSLILALVGLVTCIAGLLRGRNGLESRKTDVRTLAVQGALTNVVGGVTLLTTRPFKAGDFVELGDQSGTVLEVSVTYTKLQTPDNKIVSIPNSTAAAAHHNERHNGQADDWILLKQHQTAARLQNA